MTTIKSYTDLQQSKKLAKILPFESADMRYDEYISYIDGTPKVGYKKGVTDGIPCWSLAALLKCLSEIKSQVYTPVLFPSEGKWILQFAEYGHGNVCEVSCDNLIDACYKIIIKLHEQKLL